MLKYTILHYYQQHNGMQGERQLELRPSLPPRSYVFPTVASKERRIHSTKLPGQVIAGNAPGSNLFHFSPFISLGLGHNTRKQARVLFQSNNSGFQDLPVQNLTSCEVSQDYRSGCNTCSIYDGGSALRFAGVSRKSMCMQLLLQFT